MAAGREIRLPPPFYPIMPNSITIEGSGQVFTCTGQDTLLRAGLRAGLALPYECQSGGCGSCAFELVSGNLQDLWPEAPGLPGAARDRGRRLACQSRPDTDCVIRTRLKPQCAPIVPPQRHAVTFVARFAVTHDMAEVQFRAAEPALFKAGQYALLELPGVHGSRAYSMCNLPNDEGVWSFIVKRVHGGRGTAMLFDTLQPGDELTLDGPYGMAYLRADSPRDIICIAGGSGLSPVLSILTAAVREPGLSARRLSAFYGGRAPRDLCLPALLRRDPLLSDRVSCVTSISDDLPQSDWDGERGFVHEVVKRSLGSQEPRCFEYYFCGPPPMTDAVQKLLLLECRVPFSQLHFDRFL